MARILLSVYACEPFRGSEPGIGWNVAHSLARHGDQHEFWAITQSKNRPEIERALRRDPLPNLHFVYFDLPLVRRPMRGSFVGRNVYYVLWQLGVFWRARELHRRHRFDIAHHVTFTKYSAPSLMGLLPCPSLWGPVGGGEVTPPQLLRGLGRRGHLFELAREAARWGNRIDPISLLGARAYDIALATSTDSATAMRALGARDVRVTSSIGLNDDQIARLGALPRPPAGEPVRFASIGRLISWKGFHLGLEAFAAADIPGSEYWVIGDGPARRRLEQRAAELGIASRVTFFGRLSHDETLQRIGRCHALVHPSMHDSGGWVCLEAMAAGRPVLCLDTGGPGMHVAPEAGWLVPPGTTEQIVRDLRLGMERVVDSDWREHAGSYGQRWVKRFTWANRAREYGAIYDTLLASGEVARERVA